MASPSLFIRRVVVSGELSCDIPFDNGMNILRAVRTGNDPKSTNKVGKTGLVELIQHGLGKRHKSKAKFHFEPIADQIDTLWLEIEANGAVLTIERSLQQLIAMARVRESPYVLGIKDVPAELVPIDSLSAVLLDALDIPQFSVKTAEGSLVPLSFPTLMRAFVLHQEDSFGAILDKMIPEQRKADVIGFLTGITPADRFSLEEDLSEIQLLVQEQEGYFQSVQRFLIDHGVPTLLEAEALVRESNEALQTSLNTQHEIQAEIRQTSKEATSSGGRVDDLRQQILIVKENIAELERSLIGLHQEEARLREVLASLKVDRQKAERLLSSSTILSSVEFDICPRCLLEITSEMKQREQHLRCELCNRPLRTTSDTPPRVQPRTKDINYQIDETEEILKDVYSEQEEFRARLEILRERETKIGQLLDKELQAYVSPSVDRLLAQAHEISQKESELARANELFNQAQALAEIREHLNSLKRQHTEIEDKLREARKPVKARVEKLRQYYEEILLEVDFPNFNSCTINSRTLLPNINGSLYTHVGAAFRGLVTACYHLAMFKLAREEDTYLPRMLIIDSPAVGDLNNESHDKLLHYLAKLQEESAAKSDNAPDWQIILTTRRLIPELEPYVIKEISAPDRMLLSKSKSNNDSN